MKRIGKAGVSLAEIARKLGVSPSHISRVMRGERTPSAKVLVRMSKELGLPMEEVVKMLGIK